MYFWNTVAARFNATKDTSTARGDKIFIINEKYLYIEVLNVSKICMIL
jgi:hypothetical protein